MKYPEHEKMATVTEHSQIIGEFLDFGLPVLGLRLCQFDFETNQFFLAGMTIEQILAAYFEINLDKIEEEKRHMLEELRSGSG